MRLYDLSEFRVVPMVGDGVVQVSALEDALEEEWLDRTDDRIFFRCGDRMLGEEPRYENGQEGENEKGWNKLVHEKSVFGALEGWSSSTFRDFAETKQGPADPGSRFGGTDNRLTSHLFSSYHITYESYHSTVFFPFCFFSPGGR